MQLACSTMISRKIGKVFKDYTQSVAYHEFSRSLHLLILGEMLSKILSPLLNKSSFRVAYVGHAPFLWANVEALRDFGFKETYFETGADGVHQGLPLSEFNAKDFDIAFVPDSNTAQKVLLELQKTEIRMASRTFKVIEFQDIFNAHIAALRSMRRGKYRTCLNPKKLAAICCAVYLAPCSGIILECGCYLGGTTIYMAKVQKGLGGSSPARRIYALDTFEGLPEPTEKDLGGEFVYPRGEWADTRKELVQSFYSAHGVDKDIVVVRGLIQKTLPGVLKSSGDVSFAFLDMDQYAGSVAALEAIIPAIKPGALVIVDDTGVHGVNVAIEEILRKDSSVRRFGLTGNLDLLVFGRTP
jgi:predicted O-methyltransferase YrrM